MGSASGLGRGSAEAADKRSAASAVTNILIELKRESSRKDERPNRKEMPNYIRALYNAGPTVLQLLCLHRDRVSQLQNFFAQVGNVGIPKIVTYPLRTKQSNSQTRMGHD